MNRATQTQHANTSGLLAPSQGILQRKCACGNKTVASGECSACAKKKRSLQRKLTIGASNDPLEQEADRVADQVMAMSSGLSVGNSPPVIQRLAVQSAGQINTVPDSVNSVLASSGRPLESSLQEDMGQRFRYDFSGVRVHTGADAEKSASDINANAYTVGNSVVFGAGQLAPTTHEGQKLIAHELTHVVQQNVLMNTLQRQMITPLGAGGGNEGLIDQDRQATTSTEPTVYLCSKALDTAPIGSHALFRIGNSTAGSPTLSLQPIDTMLADCWQGVPDRDYPSDVSADADCEATGISLSCLEREFSAYPIGHYCTLGPNSNTFVGHLARRCGIRNPDPSGWTPGIDDSPPPNGTFAPDKWETLTGCETKICTTPPGPSSPTRIA